MANTENHDQSTLPAKRKCDLAVSEESSVKSVKKLEDVMETIDEKREIENVVGDDGVEEDDDENDADYEAEDARKKKKRKKKEEEEENVVDLKGKGIMRDDKGKGKMIVDEDDDESDDDSDDNDVDDDDDSDDDSEDSDDSDEFWLDDDDGDDSELENPLGEVNLDNILPSRTRNRGGGAQKGIVIADDPRDGRRNGDDSNCNA